MIINDIQSRKMPKYRNGSYSACKTSVKCCLENFTVYVSIANTKLPPNIYRSLTGHVVNDAQTVIT